MNRSIKFLAAAVAVGGLSLTGCDTEEQAVTEVERDRVETVEPVRPEAEVAEGTGEVREGIGEVGEEIGEGATAVGEGAAQLTEEAGEGIAEMGEETGEAVGAAAREPGQAGTELGQQGGTTEATSGVANAVAGVTQSAMGELNNLGQHLSQADRGRLQDVQANEQYNQALEQFRNAWQSRYNQQFSIDQPEQVFGQQFAQVSTTGADQAQVQIQASHGLPPVNTTFVREDNQWKLDAQDQINPQQLQQDLTQRLNQLAQSQDQWPQDQNEAKRFVAHNVLLTLTGQGQAGQQQGGGAQQEPLPQSLPPQGQ